MTRYLIAGAGGMLGRELQKALGDREVTALTRAQLDITDRQAVLDAVSGHDVVINAAGYTLVDEAERHQGAAFTANAIGADNLALAAALNGARTVEVSTDRVFGGDDATEPYAEDSPPCPVSVYGRTKAAGESFALKENHDETYIVRTGWLYGAGGNSFTRSVLSRARRGAGPISVVDDQRGQPTWTHDLAHQIAALLDANAPSGIYHATNAGEATWYDFARAILEASGLDPNRVHATTSAASPRPAPRPAYSVLGHHDWSAVGIPAMREWREALIDASDHKIFDDITSSGD